MSNALSAVSGTFMVNQYSTDDQDNVSIAALPNGSFALYWESDGQESALDDIQGRVFSLAGNPFSNERRATQSAANDQSDAVFGLTGQNTNVLVWEENRNGREEIWTRIAEAGGSSSNPVDGGTTRRLLGQSDVIYFDPATAILTSGGFAVAARTVDLRNGQFNIELGIFDADGRAVGNNPANLRLRVHEGSGDQPYGMAMMGLSDGNILVVYSIDETDSTGVYQRSVLLSRRFDGTTGLPLAPAEALTTEGGSQAHASAVALADGRIVVTGRNYLPNDTQELAWVFSADGFRQGDPVLLSDRPSKYNYDIDLAATADGGLIAVWTVESLTNGADRDIYLRRFDLDLEAVGASEAVTTAGQNFNAEIAINGAGGALVSWDIENGGDAGRDILARTYQLDALSNPGQTFSGDSAANTLTGGSGDDTLNGGDGRDRLDGGQGADVMNGGTGNDTYFIDSVADRIIGEIGFSQGGGIDTIYSEVSYTQPQNVELLRLVGDADLHATGNDAPGTLVGNAGDNRLVGRGGNDQINGNAGNDTLVGNTGVDTLVGGGGYDTFVITAYADSRAGAAARDVVNGFTHGQDRIDLSLLDADTTTFGVDDAFTFIGARAFSGTPGELRTIGTGGANAVIVAGDHNGDRVADMQVFVNLTTWMTGTDFIL